MRLPQGEKRRLVELADAALQLAQHGWRVFPVDRGKRPLIRAYADKASTDPERIREWWDRWPQAGIATPTGAIVVIDVDDDKGLRTRWATEAEGHEWPVTLTAMTGRPGGGMHLYYLAPEGVVIRNAVGSIGKRNIGPGVDVRGKGGLTVLPPSPHSSGRRYRWTVKGDPVPLPDWMVERLRDRPPPVVVPEALEAHHPTYVQRAWDAEIEQVASAPHGELNHRLNRAAYALARFVLSGDLDEAEIAEGLLRVAVGAGHPEGGARATIRSGMRGRLGR